jgi:GTP-binding protein LepA
MKVHYSHIRNFAIIAHVDHGKSTLADRMIEMTRALTDREMQKQVLDSMDIERERGITIKAQTVRLRYSHSVSGESYELNVLDTPGHVDFSYEVSRSLAACEGVVLVVDASQGVEAQTLANVYLALEHDLTILPVLNKVDLPAADVERVSEEIERLIGLSREEILEVSAKSGQGVDVLMDSIVDVLPPPRVEEEGVLKALVIDSWYDPYLGVLVLVRVKEGVLKKNQKIRLMSTGGTYTVEKVGIFTPKKEEVDFLGAGSIGFMNAGIKSVADSRIGDTIVEDKKPYPEALPGFEMQNPVVFCGIFPSDAGEFEALRDALSKLSLNDVGLHVEQEQSTALGLGFRCGFLGLLHLEIVEERLRREYGLELVTTAPSVKYRVIHQDGRERELRNPSDFPDVTTIREVHEPWIRATIFTPSDWVGPVMELCNGRRGEEIDMQYVGERAMLVYYLPLNEVVFDFYDRLKSVSRGYASFEHTVAGYREGAMVKVAILVNGSSVDNLSMLVHRDFAESRGRDVCVRLKELIPRQLYKVAIQAAIGGKVIARETVSALRKDVTAKCYGGDVTRKKKLLEKQKAGKKRMQQVGNVEIPHGVLLKVLRGDR